MTEIRYGIVGCAGVGNTHAEAIQAIEGAQLAACSDLDGDIAESFAEEYDVPASYTDTAEMIADVDLDAVSVCTPSGTHSQVTIEAAEAGAHVLCEKPLDVYSEPIDDMIAACEEAGVTLGGVFQKRFAPGSQRAREIVDSGELGDLVLGDTMVKWFRSQAYYDTGGWRGTRDMDGGCLLNQAIHNIDRLQWLMGGVEEVKAITDTLQRDMECEDTAAITLRFASGALGTIEATTAVKGGSDRTELNGTEGSLVLEGTEITHVEIGTGEEGYHSAETERRSIDEERSEWGDNHTAAIRDFVEAVRDGREPAVPGREARKAVDIILAAYESSETGDAVRL